uniref:Truncated RopB n=1 Tax=Streptococcus pyogenes TaxID=1314 RepID=A0A0K0P2X4_STRPY|nr:truncated RopB [Streptococcus pyogenes]
MEIGETVEFIRHSKKHFD